MIWAIVYGALAVATVAALAPPAVRVAKEVRALGRAVAQSSDRIEAAVAEIDNLHRARPVDRPVDRPVS